MQVLITFSLVAYHSHAPDRCAPNAARPVHSRDGGDSTNVPDSIPASTEQLLDRYCVHFRAVADAHGHGGEVVCEDADGDDAAGVAAAGEIVVVAAAEVGENVAVVVAAAASVVVAVVVGVGCPMRTLARMLKTLVFVLDLYDGSDELVIPETWKQLGVPWSLVREGTVSLVFSLFLHFNLLIIRFLLIKALSISQ